MLVTINIEGLKCLLKPGQTVDFNTPFLESEILSETSISIAKKLNIRPDKIFNYLKKFVGDTVEKDEILAQKKGLLNSISIVSESKGLVKEINHNTGEIIISVISSQNTQTNAFFKGEVAEIDKKQVKLKIKEGHEFSLKYADSDFGGETFYLKDSSKSIYAPEMQNKILFSDSINSYLISKVEALGIRGLVSLKNSNSESALPKAQLRLLDDFKKILSLNLPYCLINKQYSKIYFYI